MAGPREQAIKLHNRLAGVPPTASVLNQMTNLITAGEEIAAARVAIENPYFYNVKAKNWIKTWTNEARTNRAPLNDYVATVLGVIRDERPFHEILSADILYVGRPGLANVDDYADNNNDHYEDLENRGFDLKAELVPRTQSAMNNLAQTAGVITTRAAGEAFFSAGTNRRMTRFLFMNFLCHDFEALHDITIPDIYVRRDVERDPGGDSRTYKNTCVGCHAGQDALGGAFAYFDYTGNRVVYQAGNVRNKINNNNYFPDGHVVTNDSWVNLWTTGQNSTLGWGPLTSGNGARSFGQMITQAQAFGKCMAQRSFEMACTRAPMTQEEKDLVTSLGQEFMTVDNYNMKTLIAKVAVNCMGE
tara:strand:- start:14543 stop:15619 length:1077 start_codon:yes stop_codon:yes gene_type:complete